MKVKKVVVIVLGLIVLVINNACRKQSGSEAPGPIQSDSVQYQPGIAELMREAADILEKVYQDNKAYDEVNAAIHSGYYLDERVLLRDLLFPESSDLYKNEKFKSHAVDTGRFRKVFCEILLKGNYPGISREIKFILFPHLKKQRTIDESSAQIPMMGILSATEPLAIYFPYSENFPFMRLADSLPSTNKIAILLKPTLVYSDREADGANGRDAYYCPNSVSNICYQDVFVDDNYAFTNATHIITVGATVAPAVNAGISKAELVHRVYHGSSRLTRQMDKLISFTGNGGGSEIKVCRINGFLRRADEQIDDFTGDVVTLHYTRGEIRNQKWKRVFSIWDPNWNYQDIEQVYAVYEEDTKGTRTIDGSLKTTLTLPAKLGKAEGDIGFKIQASTQDEIITQKKLDRKSYLRDGLNNQGWGFLPDPADFLGVGQDWPIYDGGSIWQFTLPYRIY